MRVKLGGELGGEFSRDEEDGGGVGRDVGLGLAKKSAFRERARLAALSAVGVGVDVCDIDSEAERCAADSMRSGGKTTDTAGEKGELKNALVLDHLPPEDGDGRGETSERVEEEEKEEMLNVEDDDGERKSELRSFSTVMTMAKVQ